LAQLGFVVSQGSLNVFFGHGNEGLGGKETYKLC